MQRKQLTATHVHNASKVRVGIVVSEFNADITESLLEGSLDTLYEWKVNPKKISVVRVPGAFEIPLMVSRLAKTKQFDALIALGCVIKGETKHDEYIAHSVSEGLMRVMLETNVPVAFGILTPNTLAQAKARSRGKTNHGAFATRAALEMALKNL